MNLELLLKFVEAHPWWTGVYMLIVGVTCISVAECLGRRSR